MRRNHEYMVPPIGYQRPAKSKGHFSKLAIVLTKKRFCEDRFSAFGGAGS